MKLKVNLSTASSLNMQIVQLQRHLNLIHRFAILVNGMRQKLTEDIIRNPNGAKNKTNKPCNVDSLEILTSSNLGKDPKELRDCCPKSKHSRTSRIKRMTPFKFKSQTTEK